MELPFTIEQFYQVFASYNDTLWPAQIAMTGLALAAICLVFIPRNWSDRATSFILALLWAWMGIAYHLAFFARINPAAYAFAALSLAGALCFLWFGVLHGRLHFAWNGGKPGACAAEACESETRDKRGQFGSVDKSRVVPWTPAAMPKWTACSRVAAAVLLPRRLLAYAGAGLILFSLVIYPAWSWYAGHRFPAMPTFGLPCPTTIFTIGLLCFLIPPYPRAPLIAPVLWCFIGAQAALLLGVPQDLGLVVAAAAGLVLLVRAKPRLALHGAG